MRAYLMAGGLSFDHCCFSSSKRLLSLDSELSYFNIVLCTVLHFFRVTTMSRIA